MTIGSRAIVLSLIRKNFFSKKKNLLLVMGKRNRTALLPNNLPQLQNLIKRDPISYKRDFLQQYRHYESQLDIFKLKPDEEAEEFGSLITFISQVINIPLLFLL